MDFDRSVLEGFSATPDFPIHRQLSDFMRELIRAGALPAGTRLPGQRDLSDLWQVNQATVNKSFSTLVKEGLLRKNHGSGTFVQSPPRRIGHVGIYAARPIDNSRIDFYYLLFSMLKNLLEQEGITVSYFPDRREEEKQDKILPALAEALNDGRIDALIAININRFDWSWLDSLSIPCCINSSTGKRRVITVNHEVSFQAVIDQVLARGGRSIGFISTWHTGKSEQLETLSETFLRLLKHSPLEYRKQWIITPDYWVPDQHFHEYAKEATLKLFRQSLLPDAVLIYPDEIAKVAMQIIPALNIPREKMPALILHRNREIAYYSNYPCSWLELSIEEYARGIIDFLQEQLQNESVSRRNYILKLIPEPAGESRRRNASAATQEMMIP